MERFFSDSENVQVVICPTETKISLLLAVHVRKMHKSVTEVLALPYLFNRLISFTVDSLGIVIFWQS